MDAVVSPTRARGPLVDLAIDVAVGLVSALLLVAITASIETTPAQQPLDAVGIIVLVVAGGAMGCCRRRPEVALALVTPALAVYVLREYPGGPIWITGYVALAALGWRRGRGAGLVGAACFCVVLVVVGQIDGDLGLLLHLVFVGWSVAAVFLGDALRSRGERMRRLEERARELERTQEEETRRRIAEDRLAIARDLHDSVAHAMATITVQAGAAAHVVDRRPEAAKEALAAIQTASADVLDELGALLGLLRSAEDDDAADRRPPPGLGGIPDVVTSARNAGVSVHLTLTGPIGVVPAAVGAAAYRIVQESLTNAIRHAPGASVTVAVTAGDDGSLVVAVDDDGPAAVLLSANAGPTTGMGVRGMHERAEATGGTLVAGPRPHHGYHVQATWPRSR